MRIKPIPVIAIAICSIVAVRQVMWEFRPQVRPNTTQIIADLHQNIGVFVNRDAVYPHQFKATESESPYLFSITDLDCGDTPALNFNMVGQLFIACTLDDLQDASKLETFRILCQSAAALKNGRESRDFEVWLDEAIDGNELSLHRDVGFTATNYMSDHSIEITLLPR